MPATESRSGYRDSFILCRFGCWGYGKAPNVPLQRTSLCLANHQRDRIEYFGSIAWRNLDIPSYPPHSARMYSTIIDMRTYYNEAKL
jgi:hypothetical protein